MKMTDKYCLINNALTIESLAKLFNILLNTIYCVYLYNKSQDIDDDAKIG